MLPLQFGVGVPGGAEQIIHATRLATEAHPEWMSFQADFQNAVNCISRHLILNQLHRTGYDDLVPYFLMNYCSPSHLSVRAADGTTHWILSQEGVRQGDPLGPFFFALALQSVLDALSAELKNDKILNDIVADSPSNEQADICSVRPYDHDDTHTSNNRLWSPLAYGLGGNNPLLSAYAYRQVGQ